MAYDKAGSLFAFGLRVCKLNADGTPTVGTSTCYKSDALVKADIGLTYGDVTQITQLDGQGRQCVAYSAPSTLREGSIGGLQICYPDPNLVQFFIGGDVINDDATPTPNQIGYAAPLTGVVSNPYGVSLEFWSQAIIGNSVATDRPWVHWVLPKAFLVQSGTWSINGTAALLMEFSGRSEQNTGWGTGPADDFDYLSSRVWQWVREDTIPDLTPGFVTVAA